MGVCVCVCLCVCVCVFVCVCVCVCVCVLVCVAGNSAAKALSAAWQCISLQASIASALMKDRWSSVLY
jgi:hypothetical protein